MLMIERWYEYVRFLGKVLAWIIVIGGLVWFILIPAWQEEWIQEIFLKYYPYVVVAIISGCIGFLGAALLAAAHRVDEMARKHR